MTPATFAQLLEQYVSLGIFVVGAALAGFSYLSWRREHARRMLVVTVGYLLFAVYGLIVFMENVLLPSRSYPVVEVLEHGAALLILAGLVVFVVFAIVLVFVLPVAGLGFDDRRELRLGRGHIVGDGCRPRGRRRGVVAVRKGREADAGDGEAEGDEGSHQRTG
ncbi:hypothetical protein ACFR97_10000 [Haloplanus litoreus]|uniref:Uncharacterized protein n=2 Tax=Haloplanus litoreus TaxID=767515 RepID=A0ABD5ZTJ6_9EURY